MADSVEVSTIETTDGTIGVIRDNAARQSIANIREGKETVGSVAWENVKGRPTKVSSFENDKKYQTDEDVANTLSTHTHSMSQITDLGVFGGASATAAGSAGLVPQPAAGDQDKYLSAKGTWESITGKISGTKVTSANSADKLTTSRTLTIGNTGKSFDGSANVSWSLSEIGALPVNGNAGTVNGHTVNSDVPAGAVFTDHTYSAGDGLVLNGTEFNTRLHSRITIDLSDSKYDQNKWYPAVGTGLPFTGLVWLRVACQLNTEAAVTWSSHSSGTFTANLEILAKACGWGVTNASTIVLDYSWGWTKDGVCPVSYCQMNNSSAPVFYLRGGGRYYVYASYDAKFTVYTSAYTDSGQTVDVQSSCPSIYFSNSTIYANLAGTADAANNVAWEHTNHPATFPPSSHTHTKDQVGLGNVDNTADSAKSVKYATSAGSADSADTVDGLHEYSFLRYRGSTSTEGTDTLWSQIGIREYDNAHPEGITDGYTWGSVVSLPGIGPRFDLWYNHQTSSNGDGLRYRTGWGNDKKAWATILDSVNYNKFVVSNKSAKYTLAASNWSGTSAPYTYDLGPTYGANAIIGFDSAVGNTTQLEAARAADIQGSSTTKIYAYGDKPTVDIPIVINYQ